MSDEILLTILTPSITTRTKKLSKLLRRLAAQAEDKPVEILCWIDNMVRCIGRKRDDLIQAAQGRFLTFVDDDDDVIDDGVDVLLSAIREWPNADVIATRQECWYEGEGPFYVEFNIEYEDEPMRKGSDGRWADLKRFLSHCCLWRTTLAQSVRVPALGYFEDTEWARAAAKLVKVQGCAQGASHVYEFDSLVSEGHDRDG